jgi:hypothetical protein
VQNLVPSFDGSRWPTANYCKLRWCPWHSSKEHRTTLKYLFYTPSEFTVLHWSAAYFVGVRWTTSDVHRSLSNLDGLLSSTYITVSGWKIMHTWFGKLFLSIPKAHLYYICHITTPQAYVFMWTLQCPQRIYPGNIVMLLQGHLTASGTNTLYTMDIKLEGFL